MSKDQVSARSAAAWTSRSRRSGSGRWRAATRTCGSTPSTRRSATRPRGLQGAGGRLRRARDRPARGDRPRRRRGRVRGVLARVPARRCGPRPRRRAPGDLRPHEGLKNAIARVLRCPWQRCTVHFLRDMLGHCRRDQRGWSPPRCARSSTPTTATRRASASARSSSACSRSRRRSPAARGRRGGPARLLRFPREHWTKLRTTNPLERVNSEIGRRTDVVGIFPNDAAVIRLAGMLLIEQNDEWLVARRYLSVESMALILDRRPTPATSPRDGPPCRLTDRPRRAARACSRSGLALRARPHDNTRGEPSPEVSPLPRA